MSKPAAKARPSAPPEASGLAPAPARQRRKEARPQELLDAALALFMDKGFAATRSEEVAVRAGVSKGTLYLYYPSKEELFKAVVRENLAVHIAEGLQIVAQHQGSMAQLLRFVMSEWWRRVGQGGAGGICKIMVAEARNFPELAQFYMDEVIAPTHELIGSVLQRGMDSGEFRRVPLAETVQVLIGPVLQQMLFQNAFGACQMLRPLPEPAAVLQMQMDLMLEGLLLRPPPG